MKSVVIFKWSHDPVDAKLSSENVVEWGNAKMSSSDDDPAAMDVARAIAGDDQIIGLTIGDGKPEWAAARGAASTVRIVDVEDSVDGTVAAEAMANAIKRIDGVDVVAIGDSDWKYSVVSALAGKLGWPAFANVIDCSLVGDRIEVTCKDAKGSHVVSVQPPVLLAAKALEKEANQPGMKQMLVARKKPVQEMVAADLGCAANSDAFSLRKTVLPTQTGAHMFEGSPEEASDALAKVLRSNGIL